MHPNTTPTPAVRDAAALRTHLLALCTRVRPLVVLLGLLAAVGLLLVSLPTPAVGVLSITAGLIAGLLVACALPFATVRLVVAGLDRTAHGFDRTPRE